PSLVLAIRFVPQGMFFSWRFASCRRSLLLGVSLHGSEGRVQDMPSILPGIVRLEYRSVSMRFDDGAGKNLVAVQEVTFTVEDREVVSLIGPSGCGKSTLLNIGAGLAAPSEGAAFVDGERVEGPNAHVAFMLQKDLLLPWRTVLENVMFGVEIQRVPLAERKRRAQALLASLSLG